MNAFGAAIEERQTGKVGNQQSENTNQARQREVSTKRKGAPLKMSVQEEKAGGKGRGKSYIERRPRGKEIR